MEMADRRDCTLEILKKVFHELIFSGLALAEMPGLPKAS